RRHGDDGLAQRLGNRPRRRAWPLTLLAGHWLAIPTAGRNGQRFQQSAPPQLGIAGQFFTDPPTHRVGQDNWPESFFKMRLATVSSPITKSRSSSLAFSSRISRSRASLPFLPCAKAVSPAARKSSRQRYSVCSLISYRRANCTAGSS